MSPSVGISVQSLAAPHKSKLAVLLVGTALFLAAIDSTIVSTLMPTILSDLDGTELYPWLVSGYIASGVVAAPFAGALADRFSAKLMMLLALGLFATGMGMAYFAGDIQALIVARVAQGLGAGAIVTLSYTLIGALFSAQDRGKMQGMLSAIWGLSAIAGPVLGALLVSIFSWRGVFLAHVPVVLLVMMAFALNYQSEPKREVGSVFSLVANVGFTALLLTLLAAIQLPALSMPGHSGAVLALAAVATIAYVLSVNKKPQYDVLPRQFFLVRELFSCAILTMIAAATLYASVTILPIALDSTGDATVVDHGVVVFAAAMGWVFGSVFCGARLSTLGVRNSALMGAGLLIAGTGGLATLNPTAAVGYFMVAQALIGLGIGFIATTSLVFIQNASTAETIGRYTSAAQLFRNIGAALGINVISAIQLYSASHGASEHSYTIGFGYLLAITLASLVFVFWLPGKEKFHESTDH